MIGARPLIVRIAMIAAVSGCYASYPARPPLVAGSRELFVRFEAPRSLDARAVDGTAQRLSEVRLIGGRAIGVRNDTLELRVERMLRVTRQQTVWQRVSPPLVVLLPLSDHSLGVEERRLSPAHMAAAVVVTYIALGLAVALLFGSGAS